MAFSCLPFGCALCRICDRHKDFQGIIGSSAEEGAHGGPEGEQELQHELTVVIWRNAMSIGALDARQTY